MTARNQAQQAPPDGWAPQYKAAGPGRWLVVNIRWPSGTCGTVRRGGDGKWRIEQDPGAAPYPSRDAAARAEQRLAASAGGTLPGRAGLAPEASPPPQRTRRRGFTRWRRLRAASSRSRPGAGEQLQEPPVHLLGDQADRRAAPP